MTEPPSPRRPQPTGPSGPDFSARLGARLLRRPEPRFGVSLAAAGAALAIGGVLVWSFGYLFDGLHVSYSSNSAGPTTSGEGRRFLGVVLSLVLVVGGYALMLVRRRGALATAGVVAGGFGVPILLIFVSFDATKSLPFSVDAVYLVSILVWLVSYFAIPGAQGRAFFLALAAVDIATYIGLKAAGHGALVNTTVRLSDGSAPSSSSSSGTIAAVGLIFGLGYYAIAAFLDHRGRAGAAVALVVAGFQLTVLGIIAGISTFHQTGTGVVLVILGAILAWYGGWASRRFTTWFWAAAFVLGVILIVAKIGLDSYTGVGITLIIVGAVIAVGAHVISTVANEAADIDEASAVASG